MADDPYEQKVKDMQKYIPFLENLIKKLKNNKDDKREAQLSKMEMLYGLLNNKEKKLKLETLNKCEAVLIRLHSKVEKGTVSTVEPEDIAAPESPQNSDSYIEYENPIVIPTERRQTPPRSYQRHNSSHSSSSSSNRSHSKDLLYDRNRPRSSHYSSSSRSERSPELFRRRSPNRDRSSRYDEELRKKYERPPLPKYDRVKEKPPPPPPEDDWDEPTPSRQSKGNRSGPLPSEVLRSPPLSMDDINNLMNESGSPPSRYDPRLQRHEHSYDRNRDSLKEQSNRSSPKPVEPPVRLAYKYNPHPRRSTEMQSHSRPSEPEHHTPVTRVEEIRSINTLPSVNLSDPRLRNRSMSLFIPEHSCPPSPHPSMHSGHSPISNIQSPSGQMSHAMDRMSSHGMPDNIRSPIYGNQQFFGNYQQPQMHMMGHMHPSMYMQQPRNRFMPQPRTYGEYRKARFTEPQSGHGDYSEHSTRHTEPQDQAAASPSCLDNMYRNADYQHENNSSNAFGFKIPKIRQDPPVNRADAFKNPREKELVWDDSESWDNVKESKDSSPDKEENWDTAGENWGNANTSKSSKDNEESWDVEDNWNNVNSSKPSKNQENWDNAESWDNVKPSNEKQDSWNKQGNRDNTEENWDDFQPSKPSKDKQDSWDNTEENWDNINPVQTSKNKQDSWKNSEDNWDSFKPSKPSNDKQNNWDNTEENWDNIKPAEPLKNNQESWDNSKESWDNVNSSKPSKSNWDNVKSSSEANDHENDWGENKDEVKVTKKSHDYCADESWDITPSKKSAAKKDKCDDGEDDWDSPEEDFNSKNYKDDNKSREVDNNSNKKTSEEKITKGKVDDKQFKKTKDNVKNKEGKLEKHEFKKKLVDEKSGKSLKECSKKKFSDKVKESSTDRKIKDVKMKDIDIFAGKKKNKEGFVEKKKNKDSFVKKKDKDGFDKKKDKDEFVGKKRDKDEFVGKKKDSTMKMFDRIPKKKKPEDGDVDNNDSINKRHKVTDKEDVKPSIIKNKPISQRKSTEKDEHSSISSDSLEDSDEEDVIIKLKEKKKKAIKRKNETKIEKVPTKTLKIESKKDKVLSETEAEKEVVVEKVQLDESVASTTETIQPEVAVIETSPSTIINSSISSENIIEGRRRTRGSYSRFLTPQVTPKKTKSPNETPTVKKKRGPKKKSLDESHECAVSSTTVTDDKVVEEKNTKKQIAETKNAKEDDVATKTKAEEDEAAAKEKVKQDEAAAKEKAKQGEEAAKEKAKQDEAGGSKKEEITKEWLEGFLLNLFNPAMMSTTTVLGMLEKVLDDKKFQQVKTILDPDTEEPPAIEEVPVENIEETPKPKPPPTKQGRFRKKTELDRLNEDIRDMFISQGVLTATGRRMCTVINEKNDEEGPLDTTDETEIEPEISQNKPKPALKTRGWRGRGTKRKGISRLWNAGSKARALRQRKAESEAVKNQQNSELMDIDGEEDEDEVPLAKTQVPLPNKISEDCSDEEEELLHIVVGPTKTDFKYVQKMENDSISLADSSAENLENKDVLKLKTEIKSETKSKKRQFKVKANESPDENKCNIGTVKKSENAAASSDEDDKNIDELPIEKEEITGKILTIRPKRGRGNLKHLRGRKMVSDMNETDNDFKNIHPEMHVQSEYATKCTLCPFAGRYLSNHYVHVHPMSEVLVSRLPPSAQNRIIANEGNTAISSMKKMPNKILYLYACPFCDGQNSFTRKGWIEHFGTHTGEYTFKCSDCSRKLNLKMQIMKHIKTHCPNANAVRLRTLAATAGESKLVSAYICDLCNYIQMDRQKIVEHLSKQHDSAEDFITKIALLNCKELDGKNVTVGKKGPKEKSTNAVNPDDLNVTDQNLEVFMPMEQNDLNLDTNFMKFMSDISFSATGSPPLNTTMSIADRINERFKNTNTNPYAAESLQNSDADSTLHNTSMSMADRLTERFNKTQETDDTIDESPEENLTTAPVIEESGTNDQDSHIDDDVIMLSDGDDDENLTTITSFQKETVKTEKLMSENSESGTECDEIGNDDDDDWVDIETPPSPSCLDSETKSSNSSESKSKKNKTIYATLSRLYASIVQPKDKKKAESTGTDSPNVCDVASTISQADKNTEATKPESTLHRINNLGYSKKSSDVIKYHCLVKSCSFLYSDIPIGLESHVIYEHPTLPWDGYCHDCSKVVASGPNLKLSKEIQHMQEVHTDENLLNVKEAVSVEKNKSDEKEQPALKFRRLSGDLLSGSLNVDVKQPSPPPLQITNAVSLNKASGIWKSINLTTPDKEPLPIVIKQVFSGGVPTTATVIPRSNLKITKISSASVSPHSQIKISKVTSISGVNTLAALCNEKTASTSVDPAGRTSLLKIESVTSCGKTQLLNTSTAEELNVSDIMKLSNVNEKLVQKGIKTTKLKPWTLSKSRKSDLIVEKQLQHVSLFSQFKCMGNECDFVSNTPDRMIEHLNNHSIQQKRVQAETNAFSWLECCYCNVWTGKESMLIMHIMDKHKKDIFQCPYCFYRSCEDYNVLVHLNLFHPFEEKKIFVCYGDKLSPNMELILVKEGVKRNVKQIKCSDCDMVFMNPIEFAEHIETHESSTKGDNTYKCFHCMPSCNVTTKQLAVKHLVSKHNISCYECVHCPFATDEKIRIKHHMANCHPSNLLFCCLRIAMLGTSVTEEIHTSLDDDTAIILLSQKVNQKLLSFCPFKRGQLNSVGSGVNNPENVVVYKNTKKSTNPVIVQNHDGLEITQVQSIYKKASTMENKTDKINPTLPTTQSQFETAHAKILNAAEDIVQNTGIAREELFTCGFDDCKMLLPDLKEFRNHLSQKNRCNKPDIPCHFCNKTFKTVVDCSNHYVTHERHRYFCFLCFHTTQSVTAMTLHVANIHAIRTKANIITYALLKGKFDGKKDFFFVCSTSVKGAEVSRFGDRLLQMWERKKWAQMKKSFMPDEIDDLPRQAIFFDELYCAVCQYRTKVRTNLYRHLQFHKNEVNVANIDPVNPVPCLNAPEKHFDKMTNLACSSNTGKGVSSPGGAGSGPTTSATTETSVERRVEHVQPAFVSTEKRFICGISHCSYLSINEAILKQHLSTLHLGEKNYTCPHCKVLICTNKLCADKIIHHLKFHDTNLFQCMGCGYLHFHKPVMERHLSEKHANSTYIIYKRSNNVVHKSFSESRHPNEETTNVEPSPPQIKETPKPVVPVQMKWQCSLCKTRTGTQNQMATHINIAHNIKYRYQCSKCNFGGILISAITDHANKKHPNKVSEVLCFYSKLPEGVDDKSIDTTPLWRRDPNKVKNIRGILMEEESTGTAPLQIATKAHDQSIPSTSCSPPVDASINTENDQSQEDEGEIPFSDLTAESRMCHICSHIAPSNEHLQNHIFRTHSKDAEEVLDASWKYICYYCDEVYDNFVHLNKHWEMVHRNLPVVSQKVKCLQGRPLWFKIVKVYQCSLCEKIDEYRQIAIHHYLDHSEHVFATRDPINNLQCGHCSFTYESNVMELCDHYQEQHPAELSDSAGTEPPIPRAPSDNIPQEVLEKLQNLVRSEQWVKCRSCHMVLADMKAYKFHNLAYHINSTKTGFDELMSIVHFKCPTCNYMSPYEKLTLKHICRKVKGNTMELRNKTAAIDMDEHLRPYAMMEILFRSGFIAEKYKLPRSGLGCILSFEKTLKGLNDTELTASGTPANNQHFESDDTTDSIASTSTNRSKRRNSKKSTTKTANIDQFESEDEYQPVKPKKFKSAASLEKEKQQQLTPLDEPYSFYGTKSTEPDLGNVIANVSIDGIDKINVDGEIKSDESTTSGSQVEVMETTGTVDDTTNNEDSEANKE